jgi:hypothetical protein
MPPTHNLQDEAVALTGIHLKHLYEHKQEQALKSNANSVWIFTSNASFFLGNTRFTVLLPLSFRTV